METLTGILNVDKPTRLSSRRVVDRVVRLVKPAKAGHAGTLDPLATGVLVVCVGRATKLIEYVQAQPKRYAATFRLGLTSDTDDVTGIVTPLSAPPEPTIDQIAAAAGAFRGQILQRPPAFSALKVAGRRAYALARRGETVELAARPVTIYSLEIAGYEYPELRLDIECSGGTYIRAVGRDLAEALGTAAVMSALVRTAVGPFTLEKSCPMDALTAETLAEHMQPAGVAVAHLPQQPLDATQLEEVSHGRPIELAASPDTGELAAIDAAGQLVAVLQHRSGAWYPSPNLVGRN